MKAAIMITLLLALIGFGLLAAGVYVLAGLGWCLITGAGCAFAMSGFIRQGFVQEAKQ